MFVMVTDGGFIRGLWTEYLQKAEMFERYEDAQNVRSRSGGTVRTLQSIFRKTDWVRQATELVRAGQHSQAISIVRNRPNSELAMAQLFHELRMDDRRRLITYLENE